MANPEARDHGIELVSNCCRDLIDRTCATCGVALHIGNSERQALYCDPCIEKEDDARERRGEAHRARSLAPQEGAQA